MSCIANSPQQPVFGLILVLMCRFGHAAMARVRDPMPQPCDSIRVKRLSAMYVLGECACEPVFLLGCNAP